MTHYRIFPPYIDAYYDRKYSPENEQDLKDLKALMISHAGEWGEQVIGRAILSGKLPPAVNGKFVLCCGMSRYHDHIDDPHIDFLALCEPAEINSEVYWFNKIEVIRGDIDPEWDVT